MNREGKLTMSRRLVELPVTDIGHVVNEINRLRHVHDMMDVARVYVKAERLRRQGVTERII